jgi:hypothetical protein
LRQATRFRAYLLDKIASLLEVHLLRGVVRLPEPEAERFHLENAVAMQHPGLSPFHADHYQRRPARMHTQTRSRSFHGNPPR